MSMLSRLANLGGGAPATYVDDVFDTYIYIGNAATQAIPNGLDLAGKGGLVWTRSRDAFISRLFDTNRGALKFLTSSATTAETTSANSLTSFDSTGFTLGSATPGPNTSAAPYTSWAFRKQAKFFDVVTYTGNGTTQNISHSLGSTPGCVIVKRTDTTSTWSVWHRGQTSGYYSVLNTTAAQTLTGRNNIFGDTTTYVDPTSTQFTVGSSTNVNASGGTYVAYIFAHNAGGFGLNGNDDVITCGSYTGNGLGAGPVVTLGYEPQFLMIKNASGTGSWQMLDSMRGMSMTANSAITANGALAEAKNTQYVSPSATGFQVVDTGTEVNTSGSTYIYVAIRRSMKVPTDATKVLNTITRTGTGAAATVACANVPDAVISKARSGSRSTDGAVWFDRLRGPDRRLQPPDNNGESSLGQLTAFDTTSYTLGADATQPGINWSGSNYVNWVLTRASGFFDQVCYKGTGANATVAHNLGVAPELVIVKDRASNNWIVGATALGYAYAGSLNASTAFAADASAWNSTAPTSSVFSVGTNPTANKSGDNYVAHLFASCPGVSKVGAYQGTGAAQTINCGFTAGARFVMIKRADSTGDWYIWDTARGIISGNDPYVLLNATYAAEVTTTDYVSPQSVGFGLTASAPAALNDQMGVAWTARTSGFQGTVNIFGATYGNGLYVVGGASGNLATSPDGITWTTRASGFGTTQINSFIYGNGLYVAVGQNGILTTSTDGITWTSRTSGFGTTTLNDVVYNNDFYVAVGVSGTLTTSTDGITWTTRTSGFGTTTIRGVTYGNGLYVAVGESGTLTTSTDGITWTTRTSGFGTATIRGVTYANGLYVAVGDSGTLATSTDGITWTTRTSGFGSTSIRSVIYGNGLYVAVGLSGVMTTSPDGITWTSRTSGFGTTQINKVAYGNGVFVSVGHSATMTTSSVPTYLYLAIA